MTKKIKLRILFLGVSVFLYSCAYAQTGVDWVIATGNAAFGGRSEHRMIAFNDGTGEKLWMIGGISAGTILKNDVWNSVNGVDWSLVTGNAGFTARSNFGCVVYNDGTGDKIWVIGGDTGLATNDVWNSGDGVNWTCPTTNAAFSPRLDHACLAFDAGAGSKIWVVGGTDGSSYFNDAWYSSNGIDWTEATGNAAFPGRMGFSSAVFDGGSGNKMWIMGGIIPPSQYFSDVWCSSDGVDWTLATGNAEFGQRYYHKSVSFDNKLWVIGGANDGDSWSSPDGTNWAQTMNGLLGNRQFSAAAVFDSRMWVSGGLLTAGSYYTDLWYSSNLTSTTLCAYTSWGSAGNTDGLFTNPSASAEDEAGNVYVVDTNNKRVQKFDANGSYILQWGGFGSGDGNFISPQGIAIDRAAQQIYVSDIVNSNIQKFDYNGNFLFKWGGPAQFGGPHGMAIYGGNIYVADSNNNRIQEFTTSGVFVTKWGSGGSGSGFFNSPSGLAIDSSGNVYVSDNLNNRIQEFTSSGVYITSWGSYGTADGLFENPGAPIIDSGISIDSDGNIIVADVQNNRIQKFTGSGIYLSQWGLAGTDLGQFNSPSGVSFGPDGSMYVTEYNGNRIQKFGSCPAPTATPTPSPSPTQSTTISPTPTYTDTPSATCTGTPYSSPTNTPTVGENQDVHGDDSYAAPQPGKDAINVVFNVKEDADVNIYFYNFAGKSIGTEGKHCLSGVNKIPTDTHLLPPGIYYYIIYAKFTGGSSLKYRPKKFYIMR